MSALTDIFTSLANKIRSKLGTTSKYTPAQAISAIDDVYTKGIADTKVGTAGQAQVLSGYTFTSSSSVGASGAMPNRSRGTGTGANAQLSSNDNCPVYEVAGHYADVITNTDGVNRLCFAIPADGYYGENSDVIGLNTAYIGNAPTSAVRQGYAFTSSSGRAVNGTAPAHPHVSVTAEIAGIVDDKPFIWIPWGHYDNAGNDLCGIYTSEAVANTIHRHTGTYTFPANDTGGTKDLGLQHGYRYVNASNVYAKGKADGASSLTTINVGSVPIYSTKTVQLSAIPKLLVCYLKESGTSYGWIFAMRGTTLISSGGLDGLNTGVSNISINSNKVLSFYNSVGSSNTCTIYCIY